MMRKGLRENDRATLYSQAEKKFLIGEKVPLPL